jgi:hypothetical protein
MAEANVSPEVLETRAYEEAKEELRREYDKVSEALRRDFEVERDTARSEREAASEAKRIRLETVRLAKETLIENSRSKAVDERDVSADDIKTFANVLYTFTIS